ncbi:MAG: hypothetical protein IKO43_03660, partial [Kiritimatiellae bacterium]|nr:hypothetical protein [Kiritimatiellia bacterium]
MQLKAFRSNTPQSPEKTLSKATRTVYTILRRIATPDRRNSVLRRLFFAGLSIPGIRMPPGPASPLPGRAGERKEGAKGNRPSRLAFFSVFPAPLQGFRCEGGRGDAHLDEAGIAGGGL